MVHDPRVTAQLTRLSGVYRDPARVDRDCSSVLKSSVGAHLVPIVSSCADGGGSDAAVLVLQGTIAMRFRGTTYQLLVDIYIPSPYPNRPPICYVRLAPNMYLKDNHRHVGTDGKVYLPYLHEWNKSTHNLVELVVAMSSVFSADPPVFTRQQQTSATSAAVTSTPTLQPYVQPPAVRVANGSYSHEQHQQQLWMMQQHASESEREAVLQVEIAQANEAAEAVRRFEQSEREAAARQAAQAQAERDRLELAQKQKQERTANLRAQVKDRITRYLMEQSRECATMVQSDQVDARRLEQANKKLQRQLEYLKEAKIELTKQLATTQHCVSNITTWLDQNETNTTVVALADNHDNGSTLAPQQELKLEVHTANKRDAQLLDLEADNATISDALYVSDQALQNGGMDCEAHLRQVRALAKQQFLVRSLVLKIQSVNRGSC
jgi:ESCRT-I complex subunit TSG101